ncbi:MAG TPA: universal stress protein [Nitrospiria bacterium]|nr:universal stress protein [Nitrospiria bacterium]
MERSKKASVKRGRGTASIKKILVPTDFSEGSDRAIRYAAMMARVLKAQVRLIHVIQPYAYGMTETFNVVDHYSALKTIAEPLLEEVCKALQKTGLTVEAELANGVTHREILQAARRTGADLIIMGTHGRSGVDHLLLGSVAEKVVRLASCPVLTVRGEAKKADGAKKKTASNNKAGAGATVTLYSS